MQNKSIKYYNASLLYFCFENSAKVNFHLCIWSAVCIIIKFVCEFHFTDNKAGYEITNA